VLAVTGLHACRAKTGSIKAPRCRPRCQRLSAKGRPLLDRHQPLASKREGRQPPRCPPPAAQNRPARCSKPNAGRRPPACTPFRPGAVQGEQGKEGAGGRARLTNRARAAAAEQARTVCATHARTRNTMRPCIWAGPWVMTIGATICMLPSMCVGIMLRTRETCQRGLDHPGCSQDERVCAQVRERRHESACMRAQESACTCTSYPAWRHGGREGIEPSALPDVGFPRDLISMVAWRTVVFFLFRSRPCQASAPWTVTPSPRGTALAAGDTR